MNIKNLCVVLTLKDNAKEFPVEGYRVSSQTGHNELLITVFDQKIWVDAQEVKLYKARGSTYCWKDHAEGRYIVLNESCDVCPQCGWWRCPYCGSCRCNKPDNSTAVQETDSTPRT